MAGLASESWTGISERAPSKSSVLSAILAGQSRRIDGHVILPGARPPGLTTLQGKRAGPASKGVLSSLGSGKKSDVKHA